MNDNPLFKYFEKMTFEIFCQSSSLATAISCFYIYKCTPNKTLKIKIKLG